MLHSSHSSTLNRRQNQKGRICMLYQFAYRLAPDYEVQISKLPRRGRLLFQTVARSCDIFNEFRPISDNFLTATCWIRLGQPKYLWPHQPDAGCSAVLLTPVDWTVPWPETNSWRPRPNFLRRSRTICCVTRLSEVLLKQGLFQLFTRYCLSAVAASGTVSQDAWITLV